MFPKIHLLNCLKHIFLNFKFDDDENPSFSHKFLKIGITVYQNDGSPSGKYNFRDIDK